MERKYPWYDSRWLTSYVSAKTIIQQYCPQRMKEFIAAFEPLKTDSNFKVKELKYLLDMDAFFKIKEIIKGIDSSTLSMSEAQYFGRSRRHNHPFFNQLQHSFTNLVSEAVNEEVEPCYNFLSLYSKLGVCPIHMDAPEAKWTLDVCIEQSVPWPIYFSQVQDWPEEHPYKGADWAQQIKDDPSNNFTSYVCKPGEGILFSGSSQWHYRDRIPERIMGHHSHLLFFHFIPKGFSELIKPERWHDLFNIPELEGILPKAPL